MMILVFLMNAALMGRARWGWAEGKGPRKRPDLGAVALQRTGFLMRTAVVPRHTSQDEAAEGRGL